MNINTIRNRLISIGHTLLLCMSFLFGQAQATDVTYDGVYQWSPGNFLSLHQDGTAMIAAIFFTNDGSYSFPAPAGGGVLPVPQLDLFDLMHGDVTGSTAQMDGTRFHRECNVGYDFTFNNDATITVTRIGVSNTPAADSAHISCSSIVDMEPATIIVPKIRFNPNTAPVANAGGAQNVVAGTLVTLDGSASSDANGDALTYAWTLTAKPAGSTASLSSLSSRNPTFTADVAGTYVATLSVNDGKVNSNPATVSITARLVNLVGLGEFKQAVLLKTVSTADITAAMDLAGSSALRATPRYGVQAYRLTYVTQDGQANPILASALVTLPQKPLGALSPLLSYQHGTIKRDAEAPSNLVDTAGAEVILASLGYIVLSADYVGYGASKGAPHPYMLSGPSAAAVIDLMTAAKYWRQTQQLLDNQQLFLAGYSEGGYVTMATHRALQAGTSTHRHDIVSVVPGAGPYNVGLTLDEELKVVAQAYPLLGALLQPGFLKYLSPVDRNNVRDLLLQQLMGAEADVTFMPNFIDNYMADDRAAIQTLSDVYDWRPEAPVNLFHGRDDLTVSYKNATSTLQAMQARGAGNLVSLTDCTAQPAGHSECVPPYWRFLLATLAKVAKDL
jgi:pimeloyl-ACP methyl ester carboxylesterase